MPVPERRVVWALAATQDLREIGFHYRDSGSLAAASALLNRIEAAVLRIALNPTRARSRNDVRPGMRGMLVDSFIVFYRTGDEHVEVVRILHQRRDLKSAFDDWE